MKLHRALRHWASSTPFLGIRIPSLMLPTFFLTIHPTFATLLTNTEHSHSHSHSHAHIHHTLFDCYRVHTHSFLLQRARQSPRAIRPRYPFPPCRAYLLPPAVSKSNESERTPKVSSEFFETIQLPRTSLAHPLLKARGRSN